MLSLNIIFGEQKNICLFMILQLFYKILQIFCCLSWRNPVLNNSNPDFENTTGHYCDNKNHALQKQPQEVFYAKSCSEKFCNIYRKTLCWRLLLIKLQACNRPLALKLC